MTEVLASEISFNEAMLRLAAIHKKTAIFRYAKGLGGVIEVRALVPCNLKDHGDHVTFTGDDPDRNAPRSYRSDRIKGDVGFLV